MGRTMRNVIKKATGVVDKAPQSGQSGGSGGMWGGLMSKLPEIKEINKERGRASRMLGSSKSGGFRSVIKKASQTLGGS